MPVARGSNTAIQPAWRPSGGKTAKIRALARPERALSRRAAVVACHS
jgi:hypothetical protein